MTETSPVTFQCFPSDLPSIRAKTVGYPTDHTEVGALKRWGEGGGICFEKTWLTFWIKLSKMSFLPIQQRFVCVGVFAKKTISIKY